MGDIVFVMAGEVDVVVGASCAGTCGGFEIDGALTAGKPLDGVVGLTGAGI